MFMQIVKCSSSFHCKKCDKIATPIAYEKNGEIYLNCGCCGRYIKRATASEKRFLFMTTIEITDKTPKNLGKKYLQSYNTMLNYHQ